MKRILIFGDSITWGAWDSGGGWANRLKKYCNSKKKLEDDDYQSIYPLGVSGDTSEDLLKRFPVEFESRLDEESEMHLLIAIGTNDSMFEVESDKNKVSLEEYLSNLEKILEFSRGNVDKILFVGLTPVDDKLLNPMPWMPTHGYSNEHIKKYDDALRKFAEKMGVGYVSLYEEMREEGYKEMLFDGLHPNNGGHKWMFGKVLEKLKQIELVG